MWIKTQDKELINFNELSRVFVSERKVIGSRVLFTEGYGVYANNGFGDNISCHCLGIYDERQRALTILGDIEKYIIDPPKMVIMPIH